MKKVMIRLWSCGCLVALLQWQRGGSGMEVVFAVLWRSLVTQLRCELQWCGVSMVGCVSGLLCRWCDGGGMALTL